MISVDEIREKALKGYQDWLKRVAQGMPDYVPLALSRVGDKREASGRDAALNTLFGQNKESIGYGYRIELEPPLPNSKHKQSRVRAIIFDTGDDLLYFLGKKAAFDQFSSDINLISAFPQLDEWRGTHAAEVVKYAQKWPQILSVVQFFQENPTPSLPVRMLPIVGVDTKFIETHNAVLCQLLDRVLPIQQPDQILLAKRYGLPEQEPLIELAWDDSALTAYFHGFSRIAVPASQLAACPLPARQVLVVENLNSVAQALKTTPPPGTLVVFGRGFGVAALQSVAWLHQLPLYYWGDLDTHGFAILSQFRGYFPHVRPVFMDEATLLAHAHACVRGKPFRGGTPANLTEKEKALFARLEREGLRLEQERVMWKWPF